MKAMILAAGLGSRLKPWTDKHPKALARVNGKSLLERNVLYLQRHGIFDIIVNVHHFANQVVETVEANKGWGSAITISDETDAVLETGGGLIKAQWFFTGEADLVLMNVDILTNMDLSAMMARHIAERPLATLAVSDRDTSRYFLFNEYGILSGWRNVKTGEEKIVREATILQQQAFSGIHVIDTTLFSLVKQTGKFSMVDVYLDAAREHPVKSFDHSGADFIDVGKPESVTAAERMFL